MDVSLASIVPFLMSNEPQVFKLNMSNWNLLRMLLDPSENSSISEFERIFGDEMIPVEVGALESYGNSQRIPYTIKDLFDRIKSPENAILYGKDWHFMLANAGRREDCEGPPYEVPDAFKDDWLNWFWERCRGGADDYRFMYIGSIGSRTAVHHDVLCSYSWSANLVGCKRWYFWSPKLLPPSLWSDDGALAGLAPPFDEHPPSLVVVSGPGETVFVPSGWYHYVENIASEGATDEGDLASVCTAMIDFLNDGEASRGSPDKLATMNREEWNRHCNMTLKANSALSVTDFVELLASRVFYTYELARRQGRVEAHGSALAWAQLLCRSFLETFEIKEYDVELFHQSTSVILNLEQLKELNSFYWTFSTSWSRMLYDSFGFISDPEFYLNFCQEEGSNLVSATRFGIRNIALILKELKGNSFLLNVWSDSVAPDSSQSVNMRRAITELFETSMQLYLNLQ